MHPSLGVLWGESISAYFGLLLLGYALGIAIVARWAQRNGVSVRSVIDCGLLSLIVGILGGRLLHVLADGYFWDYVHLCTAPNEVALRVVREACVGHWADGVCHPTERDCWAWAKFYNGGLAFYGGLALAVPAVGWLARRDGLPLRALGDAAAIGTLAALAVARVGCFLAGCCYGAPTAYGVRFPGGSPASEGQFRAGLLAHPSLPSLPVHPTQLYEAAVCLVLAVALASRAKRFAGQTALLGLLTYAVARFAIEFVRADDRGQWRGLSTSQWLGIALAVTCVPLWRRWSER